MDRSPVPSSPVSAVPEIKTRPQVKRYKARSKWVPGTSDRLELYLLDGNGCVEVSVRWFTNQFGREAMDALYLRGKFEFECEETLWKSLLPIREHA
jgi:hypothetical protein